MQQNTVPEPQSPPPVQNQAPPPTENQALPPPKRGIGDFLKGLLWTALPFVIFSLLSVFGWITSRTYGLPMAAINVVAAPVLFLAALVLGIVFAARGKKRLAAGIFSGLGIGIVAQGLSCLALIPISSGL